MSYTHNSQTIQHGLPLVEAQKAIIMIHGRGASAESILGLAHELNLGDAAILAPQATNHSWYPLSFLAPLEENQPALNSALKVIDDLVKQVNAAGIVSQNIYFLGFSQGACLALEYAATHADRYGGVIALTGGLIGDTLNHQKYQGDFSHTPILITTGDPDPHVPLSRVEESVAILENLCADVTLKVYKGRAHTVQRAEIDLVNTLILK